jgi:glutaredoxin
MITVYTLDNCPNCKELKKRLKGLRLRYEERQMDTAESITEMRVNQCFIYEAPVLQIDDIFMNYEDANKWLDKEFP